MNHRKLALRIGVFTVGLALALGTAELALRRIGFQFLLYPSKVQFGWPDPASIQLLYRVDQRLLWVPKDYEEQVAKAIATPPKHVSMGCSCTEFGLYVDELQKLIDARHPGHSYSFVNLGVGGWSSYQGLQQMQRDVVRIAPKLVTIYYGWNDHWATHGIEDKHIGEHNLEQSRALLWLSDRSRVAQLLNKTVFRGDFQGLTREKRVSLPDFRTNLETMVTLAREAGIVPVLLTAPSSHQQGDEPVYLSFRWLHDRSELVPLHRAYADVVREVAAKHDVHLVDLLEAFSALDRETIDASFRPDGVHLNEAGDKRAAELLYDSLDGAGLLSLLVE